MATRKERLLDIVKDAIKNDCDYIVLKIRVDNSEIDIRSRYFGKRYMKECINIIKTRYDDMLINRHNDSITITSAVGAYKSNTLKEIEDALFSNQVYLL